MVAWTIGTKPASIPTTCTTSHSRPLARWKVASSTPPPGSPRPAVDTVAGTGRPVATTGSASASGAGANRQGTPTRPRTRRTTASWSWVRARTAWSDQAAPASARRRIAAATASASARSIVVGGERRDGAVGHRRPGRGHVGRSEGGRGGRHDLGRAPVVGVEVDDLEPGDHVGQRGEQSGVGAVPPVDGLVRVADGAQVGAAAHECVHQAELRRVDVLELVDGQVPVAPVGLLGEGGVVEQQVGGPQQHVVEVEEAAPGEAVLVVGERLGHPVERQRHLATSGPCRVRIGIRRQAPCLGPPDLGVDGGSRPPVSRQFGKRAPTVLHQGRGCLAGVGRPAAEQGERQLVQRPRTHAGRGDPARPGRHRDGHAVAGEPVAQLVGGLTGERAHHGVVGVGRAVADAPCDPQREDPGLARAGPGHDAQGVGGGADRLELGRGEPGQRPLEPVVGDGRRRRVEEVHSGGGYSRDVAPRRAGRR